MALPAPLRPAVRPDSDQPDTQLGRPGDGSRLLVETRPPSEPATTSLVLVRGVRTPRGVRDHIARLLAMEEVEVTYREEDEDLRVHLSGPPDVVEHAGDVVVRVYLALRRRT